MRKKDIAWAKRYWKRAAKRESKRLQARLFWTEGIDFLMSERGTDMLDVGETIRA